MSLNIIHLISTLDRVNFGIWNAAMLCSPYLKTHYGTTTYAWITETHNNIDEIPKEVQVTFIGSNASRKVIDELVIKLRLSPSNSLVVSHGCWLAPSRVGRKMNKLGFRWLYTPHGMLEPWSLQHGALKKKIYFNLVERRYALSADRLRAVSRAEADSLLTLLNRKADLIENCVAPQQYKRKPSGKENWLFLGRLHHKKGIVPFVKAWHQVMRDDSSKQLIIAGPDEGEFEHIQGYLAGNVRYEGAVYGAKKEELLSMAHYFVLPSFSEGFPTSVVEAMSYGAIPLVSLACNLPEVYENNLGYRLDPDEQSILNVLQTLRNRPFDEHTSRSNTEFANRHWSIQPIGDRLQKLYNEIVGNHG